VLQSRGYVTNWWANLGFGTRDTGPGGAGTIVDVHVDGIGEKEIETRSRGERRDVREP
jgi:hypothetical protein